MTAAAILAIIDAAPVFDASPLDPAAEAAAVRAWGLTELDAAIASVRASEAELRNVVLAAASQRLGRVIASNALDAEFARAALEEAAVTCGLIRDDGLRAVRKAIAAAVKLGQKQPHDLRDVRRGALARQSRPRPAAVRIPSSPPPLSSPAPAAAAPAAPAAGGESERSQTGASPEAAAAGGRGGDCDIDDRDAQDDDGDDFDLRLAFYPLTDLGNAERFRERYRGKLIWNVALGWLAWDGKRWSRHGADDLVKIAEHQTVRAIQQEAEAVRASGLREQDGGERGGRDFIFDVKKDQPVFYSDKIASWGRASESINKLGALSKRGAPYLAVSIDRLDADKMKINVNNGTLTIRRLADGEDYVQFGPHDPADLITKLSPVDFDPDAQCPAYDTFLARVQPDGTMRIFLHQWGGLSLTGDVGEQKLAFFHGKGSNGKSVLIDAWSYVAGDYGETVPIETFLDQGKARNAGQATPDLAILPGVRMLRTSEPEKNSKLAEALIKLATGGEPIQARHLNRDFFKFYPQFKLTISGNYRPSISGADEGIWRRMQLVPFMVTIPKEERDVHLGEKLRQEASGILNRLLDGLRQWCDSGLTVPEAVTSATADYRSASDPLGRFLSACVVESSGDRVQSSALYAVFEAWCKASGEATWKQKGFSMAMEERGFKRKQSDVMWFLDIKLIRHVDDFVDAHGNPKNVIDDDRVKGGDPGDMEF